MLTRETDQSCKTPQVGYGHASLILRQCKQAFKRRTRQLGRYSFAMSGPVTDRRIGGVWKFTVVGAGITGLSSAYRLALGFPRCHITILYDKCCPDTTSNHGFGICSLRGLDEYDSPNTPAWSLATTRYCKSLVEKSPILASAMGINAVRGHLIEDKKNPDVVTSRRVDATFRDIKEASDEEVQRTGLRSRYKELAHVFERPDLQPEDIRVMKYGSWVLDNHSYLPWLKKELELMAARGDISEVKFIQRRLTSLSEAVTEECDILVNCSGLGARLLVGDDRVVPIRGQYLLVRPNIEEGFLIYGGHTFLCPKPGRIALGSVYQIGRSDTALDPRDSEDILRRCCAFKPELAKAEVVGEAVGIRPGRKGGPRVELDSEILRVPVIHNYGHGSRGILQHWGCALEVERLAASYLKTQSKL